jgi:predicted HAD superfamily hydrolase
LKEFELLTEMKNSYLIITNCNRVKDGDILISDMYLCDEDIMKLLKYHGFNKKVKMYASPTGKSSKRIWPVLMEKYNINLHLGDNHYSDVVSPSSFGINSELTSIHKFSDIEHFFYEKHPHFALLLREFRHKNPYDIKTNNYHLYNDQMFNIPCLIMYSQSLYEIMIAEKRTKLLLLTRDGCLLIHIFKLLYPHINCQQLHSSRKIHKNPNEEYKNYLKENYDNTCLIGDLYATRNRVGGHAHTWVVGCLCQCQNIDVLLRGKSREFVTYFEYQHHIHGCDGANV